MKKRILSVLLAAGMITSMATIGANAVLNSDGSYTPADGTKTSKYYFYMPKAWDNDAAKEAGGGTATAGLYWWSGTDACGAVDGSGGSLAWPGYRVNPLGNFTVTNEDETESTMNADRLYAIDVPADVPTIVWNNYVNGGTDKELPIYLDACQTNNSSTEFYSYGDVDLYDNQEDEYDFFTIMEEAVVGDDKTPLGDFADNFFVDDTFGVCFRMNNMIWVVDESAEAGENFEGKPTFIGEWYFYYGDGTYGSWPTKEDSQTKGIYGSVEMVNVDTGEIKQEEKIEDENIKPTTPASPGNEEESTTVAPTTAPADSSKTGDDDDTQDTTKKNIPSPSSDAKSSTNDTANNSNGAIPTGAAPIATVAVSGMIALGAVIFLTRKRNAE